MKSLENASPAVKRDGAKARRPLLLRWASSKAIIANHTTPMKTLLSAAMQCALLPSHCMAASIQCMLSVSRCIKSLGTVIPSKKAIEVLDRCAEFTVNDIGRVAMKLGYNEINDHSGEKLTPLVRAWHAYGDLIDMSSSPSL